MSPSSFIDTNYWAALSHSPTFHDLLWSIAAFACVVTVFCCAASHFIRRVRFAALARDERGAASAMDLVLVMPIFVFIMLLIFQWSILLKNTLIVHYAAFAAARSARVHLCPPPANSDMAKMGGGRACTGDSSQAETAARYALIMASPFDDRLGCEGGCNPPGAVVDALARGTETTQNINAWQRQARYAFDGPNVEVSVSLQPVSAKAGTPGEPIATARVRYRHILLPWMEWTFGNGRRSDGNAYAIIEAEVTVL